MFEGFSDEARAVVDAGHEQARGLGHHATGTAHLLLGLLTLQHKHTAPDPDDDAPGAAGALAAALAAAGVSLESLRTEYAQGGVDPELDRTPANDRVLSGGWGGPGLPWTGGAKKAFEFALRRALQLSATTTADSGQRQLITPAHVLLGILDRPETTGRRLILQPGVDLVQLTREAERIAAAAPLVTVPTAQDAWVTTDVARTPTPDEHGAIFSIFGLPSWLRLDGPAARQVLAEARDSGDLNSERLLAAAEADAATVRRRTARTTTSERPISTVSRPPRLAAVEDGRYSRNV